MAAHIWWITHVSSLGFGCSHCGRTLRFNKSNKWSIGFKSRLLQAIWVFAHCLLYSLLVCFYPHDMMRNPVPTSYRDWHWYEDEKNDRMTSFRYLITVMFPRMVTLIVFVCLKTLERVLLCLFSPYLMVFFIIDNQRGILSYQIR